MRRNLPLVPAAALAALIALGAPAHALFGSDDSIHIPEPHLGDEGVYSAETDGKAPVPVHAFTWAERRVTTDRWGRAVQADVLREFYLGAGADGGPWWEAVAAFAGGRTSPLWSTFAMSPAHAAAWRGFGGWDDEQAFRYSFNFTVYGSSFFSMICGARNALQGTDLRPGDAIPLEAVCPGVDVVGIRSRLRSSEEATFLGRGAVALTYEVTPDAAEGGEAMEVRVVFADGLPYPAEITFALPAAPVAADGEARGSTGPKAGPEETSRKSIAHAAPMAYTQTLTGFARGSGGPLLPPDPTIEAEPSTRPGASFSSLTRGGPADGDAGLFYPLEEAVANVEADSTLTRFQAWRTAHPGAVLVQGRYVAETASRDPARLTEETRGTWVLTFADASGEAFDVRTEKARPEKLAGTPLDLPSPPVESKEEGAREWDRPVPLPGELPRGLDLASALAAWPAHAPPSVEGPANEIEYRIDADAAGRPDYVITVGHAPPQDDSRTVRTAGVTLDARTGAARSAMDATMETSGYPFLPFAYTPFASSPANAAFPFLGGGPEGVEFVAGAAGMGLLAAVLAAIGYKLGWFAPLFTRLKHTEILDNDLRRTLYDRIAEEPGVHLNALAENTRAGNGAVTYHLNTLEREGLVRSVELPGYRRYFVTGSASPRAMRALAELRAGSARTIYDVIRETPGISVSEVATRVGITPPAVHKTVERLVRADLLEKERGGRVVKLTARDPHQLN